MSEKQKIRRGLKYIAEAVQEYLPQEIFVGFSGGTDSLLCADITMKYFPNAKIFHANTGIGLNKTREYVREYCKKREWELVEIHAKQDCGQDYEQIVMQYGFPGSGQHIRMYARLKERCIRVLHRKYKRERGKKIMLITGIRHDESNVRSGYSDGIIRVDGGVVWVNAWYWFTKQDKYDYISSRGLEVNPVHKVIGMSGECLCGAYAHEGELDLIRLIEPGTAEYIEQLQKKVMKNFPWGWEQKPPKWWVEMKKGQEDLFIDRGKYQPLCVGCGKTDKNKLSIN